MCRCAAAPGRPVVPGFGRGHHAPCLLPPRRPPGRAPLGVARWPVMAGPVRSCRLGGPIDRPLAGAGRLSVLRPFRRPGRLHAVPQGRTLLRPLRCQRPPLKRTLSTPRFAAMAVALPLSTIRLGLLVSRWCCLPLGVGTIASGKRGTTITRATHLRARRRAVRSGAIICFAAAIAAAFRAPCQRRRGMACRRAGP